MDALFALGAQNLWINSAIAFYLKLIRIKAMVTVTKEKKNPAFADAEKAVKQIKRIIPKLSDSEIATLELLLDKEAMLDLQQSLKDVKKGRVIPLEKV